MEEAVALNLLIQHYLLLKDLVVQAEVSQVRQQVPQVLKQVFQIHQAVVVVTKNKVVQVVLQSILHQMVHQDHS